MNLNSEPGSSSWLTALPLHDQGFHLNKQEFWDALHLRYGWKLVNIPSHCVCGSTFTPDHAMICRRGGLTFVRHNEIRDLTAEWLNKICYDVTTEPPLQPLSGEVIIPRTANQQDEAHADIHARGFWGQRQSAFFDVRVFHPNAPSYRNSNIPSIYRHHEQAKKREYGDRVREVELASFTPLVFATTGGMGREATIFYRRLADLLSRKSTVAYSTTLAWIRSTLSFSLLRSATVCIRGSRSISHRSTDASPEVGLADCHKDYCSFSFFLYTVLNSCPALLTQLCAGGGGKGVSSSLGIEKKTTRWGRLTSPVPQVSLPRHILIALDARSADIHPPIVRKSSM